MSAATNDGGSAFPVLENNGNGQLILSSAGMSLRDYFIAHAPAEPQSWFEPVMPSAYPADPPFSSLTKEDQKDWRDEKMDWAPEQCSAELIAYAKAREQARKSRINWTKDIERERYLQWPFAWADAMLARRES